MTRPRREDGASAWWRRATPAQRLRLALVPLALLLVCIGAFHVLDATSRGESLWPVVFGLTLAVLVLGSVLWLVRRPIEGLEPADAMRTRARQIAKWVAPLAAGVAVLSAIAAMLSRD